jgi:putative hemolysin
MNEILFEIIIILLLILANGVLAMSEIAIVSSRAIRLQQQAANGNKGAQVALELADDPGRFLSTVQIGITLVGIFTGAFGGATLAGPLASFLTQFQPISRYSGPLAIAIVVVIITYLSLVIGELVPKRIALHNPERAAIMIAQPMASISRLAAPLVGLLSVSTALVLKLLGIGDREEGEVTEHDIEMMIGQGTESGVFEPIEHEMVKQVFRMSDQRAENLITPRPEVVSIDLEETPQVNHRKIIDHGHSYLPVIQGDLDHVQGYVRAVDLLAQSLLGQDLDYQAVLRAAQFVPERAPVFDVLERFKRSGDQIAFVVDEFGGIQGLLTHTDILEAIIGDIHEPEDELDPDIVQRADGTWLLDGMVPIHEFRQLFELKHLPGEEEGHFHTLGGFVITYLGRIPETGEQITVEGLQLEVVDMDSHRVDKLLVTLIPPTQLPDQAQTSA